jgi:hypothetical protein
LFNYFILKVKQDGFWRLNIKKALLRGQKGFEKE